MYANVPIDAILFQYIPGIIVSFLVVMHILKFTNTLEDIMALPLPASLCLIFFCGIMTAAMLLLLLWS